MCERINSEESATPEIIAQVKSEFASEDIEIDDDAPVDRTESGLWVGAWVWMEAQ